MNDLLNWSYTIYSSDENTELFTNFSLRSVMRSLNRDNSLFVILFIYNNNIGILIRLVSPQTFCITFSNVNLDALLTVRTNSSSFVLQEVTDCLISKIWYPFERLRLPVLKNLSSVRTARAFAVPNRLNR